MITDVPSHEDLEIIGVGMMHDAWERLTGSPEWLKSGFVPCPARWDPEHFDNSQAEGLEQRSRKTYDRWLAQSAVLAALAVEFVIKARIAAVSPYLLLSKPLKPSKGGDVSFLELQTIGAADLVTIWRTVGQGTNRPAKDLEDHFKVLRDARNRAMHISLDLGLSSPVEVLRGMLQCQVHLWGEKTWPRMRREYFRSGPEQASDLGEHSETREAARYEAALDALTSQDATTFLGVEDGARFFRCATCYSSDIQWFPRCAFRSHDGLALKCLACGNDFPLRESPCKHCTELAVLEEDDHLCMACGQHNSEPDEGASS